MKKRTILLIALMVMVTMVFAACTETKLTLIEQLRERYGEISEAATVKQEITITQGNFTQYESSKTYSKVETGYDVTGSEKRLNDAESDEPYTVTPIETHVDSVQGATPTLTLDESYFEEGYRLTETGLSATVKQSNIKDVFGVSETELTAPTSNLTLELRVSGEHLATVRINYVSNNSNVTIVLTMSY